MWSTCVGDVWVVGWVVWWMDGRVKISFMDFFFLLAGY